MQRIAIPTVRKVYHKHIAPRFFNIVDFAFFVYPIRVEISSGLIPKPFNAK